LASYHPQTCLVFLPEHIYQMFRTEHLVPAILYVRYNLHMTKAKKKKQVKKHRKMGNIRASAEESRADRDQTEEWYRPRKKPVTLRLDADVIAWFKTSGKGYQTRINRELRRVMMESKERG